MHPTSCACMLSLSVFVTNTYVHFTVKNINETAQDYDEVEHIPGIPEVVLLVGKLERGRKRKREKKANCWLDSILTYVELSHGDIDQAAQDNDEIKTVPRVTKIILERKKDE